MFFLASASGSIGLLGPPPASPNDSVEETRTASPEKGHHREQMSYWPVLYRRCLHILCIGVVLGAGFRPCTPHYWQTLDEGRGPSMEVCLRSVSQSFADDHHLDEAKRSRHLDLVVVSKCESLL
jgi:hypothetical protein